MTYSTPQIMLRIASAPNRMVPQNRASVTKAKKSDTVSSAISLLHDAGCGLADQFGQAGAGCLGSLNPLAAHALDALAIPAMIQTGGFGFLHAIKAVVGGFDNHLSSPLLFSDNTIFDGY